MFPFLIWWYRCEVCLLGTTFGNWTQWQIVEQVWSSLLVSGFMCIRVRKIDYRVWIWKAKVPKTCSIGYACWLHSISIHVGAFKSCPPTSAVCVWWRVKAVENWISFSCIKQLCINLYLKIEKSDWRWRSIKWKNCIL